ncbi:uncharacterized protein LOC111067918 [Drosophila obscura]|uniref:uncharacterized protein LOC111067918 n=1 Tax=Drosophila obscura TaxID=7282 RepID=UPI001BB1C48F|nr:uncharacterized protein LOC111067918 [Drosophila obscura]
MSIHPSKMHCSSGTKELKRLVKAQDNFYFDYVAQQNNNLQNNKENNAEEEEKPCSSFHAREKRPRVEPESGSYPIISTPIWNRRHGPMPPTISTPEFDFMAKFVANKKSGVVRVAEIFDTFAWGRELKKRGFQSPHRLPGAFRRYVPKQRFVVPKLEPEPYHVPSMMDEYRALQSISPIPEAPQVPAAVVGAYEEIPAAAVAENLEVPAEADPDPDPAEMPAVPIEPPRYLPRHIPTSEELVQMARDIEAGLLDPETWPFNCRMPRPTSPFPTWRYDNPPTPPPSPPPPMGARLVPSPEEDALAVDVLLQEEQKREEQLAVVASQIPSNMDSQGPVEYWSIPFVPRGLRLPQQRKWIRSRRTEQPGSEAVEIDEISNVGKLLHLYNFPTARPRIDTFELMAAANQEPEDTVMEDQSLESQMDVPPELEQVMAQQEDLPATSTSTFLAQPDDISGTSFAQLYDIPGTSNQLMTGLRIEVAMPEDLQQLQQEQPVPGSSKKTVLPVVERQHQPVHIGNVQPKPQDQTECQQWIQQTSQILTSQYKALLWEDRYRADIDFEDEIEKEQQKQRMRVIAQPSNLQENDWQRSYRSMLDDFEDRCEETASEYRDPQAKRLRSKWIERFGKGSSQNLCRKLDTKMPTVRAQPLLKIKILAKSKLKRLETLVLRIELKYSKTFCTLHLHQTIDLKAASRKLQRIEYKTHINILQKCENTRQHSEHSRISWLWPNGTLTIINGCRDDKNDLIDVQNKLLAPLLNLNRFQAAPAHNLQYLRMRSAAHFGFQIKLKIFAEWFVLSNQTCRDDVNSEYVYYVTSELPGVVAQLHDHGRVYVYAMTIQEADKLLLKLYTLIHNHREDLVKVEKPEKKVDPK